MKLHLITLQALLAFVTLTSTELLAHSPKPDQTPPFRSSCYVNKSNHIKLAIDKNTPQLVSVVLRRSNENEIVATQYMPKKQSKSTYVFDVNELPDGLYTLELSSGQHLTTHQVTINTAKPIRPNRQVALNR